MLTSLFVVPLASGCGSDMPDTVPVVMGTVTSGVSASGTLRYITEEKIGFPQGGEEALGVRPQGVGVVRGQLTQHHACLPADRPVLPDQVEGCR